MGRRLIGKGWKARSNKKLFEQRRAIARLAKEKPCADCGVQYPYYVMQFDHVRGVKLFTIATGIAHYGITKLLDEIAKCDVVCANCHMQRTHGHRLDNVLKEE